MWAIPWILAGIWLWCIQVLRCWTSNTGSGFGRRKVALQQKHYYYRFPRKPDWVTKELIRMKALMPDSGCRALAASFNRRFAGKESVGKTYVYNVLVKHRHEIILLRKNLKKKQPRPVPHNLIWSLDLTGKPDSQGRTHNILGIVEHASRALTLRDQDQGGQV